MNDSGGASLDFPLKKIRVWKWNAGSKVASCMDELAREEPLEIRVDTRQVSVTMRTPGHDDELAVGFLLSEGIIRKASDVREIRWYPRNPEGNAIDVFLSPGVPVDFESLTRHVFVSSSCGLCGKAAITAVHQHFPPARKKFHVDASVILSLPEKMLSTQSTFIRTGGLHAAAVFTESGEPIVLREDIGRHNAVDKALGHCAMQGKIPLERNILMVSGRASFEILQKALSARIPVVCAISAPSSLAVEFARRSGMALVGFLRTGRFNIYAGRQRIGV